MQDVESRSQGEDGGAENVGTLEEAGVDVVSCFFFPSGSADGGGEGGGGAT